jgi:hypothetical protein
MSKTCNSCSTNDMAVMPIAQHEKDQNRLMGIIKWLIAVILVLIVLLVGSNAGWLWYESQFEVVEETTTETNITQDNNGGYNNYIGNDGDIVNGETDNKNQENN